MAVSKIDKTYTDYVVSGNRKLKLTPSGSSTATTYTAEDATTYSQEGNVMTASDMNTFVNTINAIIDAMGTQVTFSLSGTTLTITTK